MTLPPKPSFREFWPYYLQEHARPLTRALHAVGTVAYLSLLVHSVVTGAYARLWLLPVIGYGFAWGSHLFVEKNRPATFKHPLLSLWGDHVMAFHVLTGSIGRELEKHGVRPRAEVARAG